MFFKIGALKNFAILGTKKRLHHFSSKKQPLGGLFKKEILKILQILQANVNTLIDVLLKFLG